MTDEEFNRIRIFMKKRYGIDMSGKKEIIKGRLGFHIRQAGYKTYSEYMNALELDFTGRMEKDIVNILTTNHTYFMRETEHFDFLKEEVLPWAKKKAAKNKDICTWCAASSTGEEPYTLAMIIKDFFGIEHKDWDTKILATDVSTEVLKTAMQGIYSKDQIYSVPDIWKRRYFKPLKGNEKYKITDDLKKEVIFRQFNLMNTFPFRRKMHIVFMRNVMIYFDEKTKRELVQKVYDVLEPGGYFFVGRTETIDRDYTPFKLVQPSIFRK